jgi:GTP-binding protein YchF
MKIGLIGLPLVGKTTFFNLLTKSQAVTSSFTNAKIASNIGSAKIPDARVDFLAKLYKPKKVTYASIDFIDVPGLVKGSSSGGGLGNQFLENIRKTDALVHVIRVFDNPDVTHTEGGIDPLRDIEIINLELLFADLGLVETRIERIETAKKVKKENLDELEALKKCREALEAGKLLSQIDLSKEEKAFLSSFEFLSEKPLILLANISESDMKRGSYKQKASIVKFAADNSIPLIECCAKIEMELNDLDDAEKELFMEDMGIKKSGIDTLASTSYELLGLISFLTTGEDEVRAWTIKKGLEAKKAAGKIHSDIERGFIRAEVVKFRHLLECQTMNKVKEKGLFRLEGKEYTVEDGDIINFRFNV